MVLVKSDGTKSWWSWENCRGSLEGAAVTGHPGGTESILYEARTAWVLLKPELVMKVDHNRVMPTIDQCIGRLCEAARI